MPTLRELTTDQQPESVPEGAMFYGHENSCWVEGWYKYDGGQWWFVPEGDTGWEVVPRVPGLGVDLFLIQHLIGDYDHTEIHPEAQYIKPAVAYQSRKRNAEGRWLDFIRGSQIWIPVRNADGVPLADIGWVSPATKPADANDVDNW